MRQHTNRIPITDNLVAIAVRQIPCTAIASRFALFARLAIGSGGTRISLVSFRTRCARRARSPRFTGIALLALLTCRALCAILDNTYRVAIANHLHARTVLEHLCRATGPFSGNVSLVGTNSLPCATRTNLHHAQVANEYKHAFRVRTTSRQIVYRAISTHVGIGGSLNIYGLGRIKARHKSGTHRKQGDIFHNIALHITALLQSHHRHSGY